MKRWLAIGLAMLMLVGAAAADTYTFDKSGNTFTASNVVSTSSYYLVTGALTPDATGVYSTVVWDGRIDRTPDGLWSLRRENFPADPTWYIEPMYSTPEYWQAVGSSPDPTTFTMNPQGGAVGVATVSAATSTTLVRRVFQKTQVLPPLEVYYAKVDGGPVIPPNPDCLGAFVEYRGVLNNGFKVFTNGPFYCSHSDPAGHNRWLIATYICTNNPFGDRWSYDASLSPGSPIPVSAAFPCYGPGAGTYTGYVWMDTVP